MRSTDGDLRVGGMGIGPRFVVAMTASLFVVMLIAGAVLYAGITRIAENEVIDTVAGAVRTSFDDPIYKQVQGEDVERHAPTNVKIFPIIYGPSGWEGRLFEYTVVDKATGDIRTEQLVVPGRESRVGDDVLGMIFGILLAVVIVGAVVALWVANQVSHPIQVIIEDVRTIARGDLTHRTHVGGGGEVELLARSIDRMTRDLQEAQGNELELSIREREMDLAGGVREALLPLETPWVDGYDLGAAFLPAPQFGGDFHAFIELHDGRVGLLVCDVSGQGVPAALVGATARSYLKSVLQTGGDVMESLSMINTWLAGDMRRGMYVTALYCLVDPAAGQATVACAGHKIPLLRYCAEDGQLRVIHPEGIALGFDKGPVFEKRLEVVEIPVEPGDRILLTNSAPVELVNPDGRELGEKAFYGRVMKHANQDTTAFLKALRRDLLGFVGEDGVSLDVSLVTLSREA